MYAGNTIQEEKTEASKARRNIAGLLDAFLIILLAALLAIFKVPAQAYELFSSFNSSFAILICLMLYRLISLAIFGSTIGMKICGIVLLNADERPLSILENVLASFFILYNGVSYYKGN